jgi:hypothetical protein
VETLGIIQKKGWGTYYLRDERTGKLVAHKIWPDKTKFPTKKEIPGHLRLVVDNTSTIAEVSQASR